MNPPTYSNQAARVLADLDKQTKQRIRNGIYKIPSGDIKLMKGFSDGRKRLRIGKYRIVFLLSGNDLHIMEIGSRGDIYK